MAKKSLPASGIVYSTDPGFTPETDSGEIEITPEPALQKLQVKLDKKNRNGKAVTLLEGFTGNLADAEILGKKLKAFCGTGGSVKAGEILVQGDNREKIVQWLTKNGYKNVKKM